MKPRFYNNSKIPVVLSYLSPVSWINLIQGKPVFEIWAITILWFVFCRGTMNENTIRHESIHIKQQEDLFWIGFYPLYSWDWLKGLFKYNFDAEKAYYQIRAEQEAYANHSSELYLKIREKRMWLRRYRV